MLHGFTDFAHEIGLLWSGMGRNDHFIVLIIVFLYSSEAEMESNSVNCTALIQVNTVYFRTVWVVLSLLQKLCLYG